MPSEREKMLAGELYDPIDAELVAARARARDLCWTLNATLDRQKEERRRILRELFAAGGDSVWMQLPFFYDDGSNIELGCTPMDPFNELRRRAEFGRPVEIGWDVWVGGRAIILPGVRIGSRAVIGPGASSRGTFRRGCSPRATLAV